MAKKKKIRKCKCGKPIATITHGLAMLGGWRLCYDCRKKQLDKITKTLNYKK